MRTVEPRRSDGRSLGTASFWPRSFMQFVFVSARLRRWVPLHRGQMVRPKRSDGPQGFAPAARCAEAVVLARSLALRRRRYDRPVATAPRLADGVAAAAGVVGAIGRDRGDRSLPSGTLIEQARAAMGASPMSLVVICAARTSRVASSDGQMHLAPDAALRAPRCLHACHSPSPRTSTPVLSTSRCSGPPEPR